MERRESMVRNQIEARGLRDAALLAALRQVARELFVPKDMREFAYDDRPLSIGFNQTISQPYIVALMISAARLSPTAKVLEVGGGSGYAAAVMSQIAECVITIERQPGLAEAAARRLAALGYSNVRVIAGDGSSGHASEAPFDAIIVPAFSARVPEALKHQLAPGTLIMPVGPEREQSLVRLIRTGPEDRSYEDLEPVRFMPLTSGP